MNDEDLIQFRDTAHLPEDAGEYADDLMDILNRIPKGWGRWISCDRGWYKLLADTNRKMKLMLPTYEISQIKEKYGTLRFYWSIPFEDATWANMNDDISHTVYDIMSDIAHAAENASAYICETCGEYGKTRNSGYWLKTLCTTCAIAQEYPLEDWEQSK